MPRYRWNSVHEWLADAIDDLDISVIASLLEKVDADIIQDFFQSQMVNDGYFNDLDQKFKVTYKKFSGDPDENTFKKKEDAFCTALELVKQGYLDVLVHELNDQDEWKLVDDEEWLSEEDLED